MFILNTVFILKPEAHTLFSLRLLAHRRKFLECIEDNVQVLDKPTREVLLDLTFTNADKLIKEMKIGGCLGCSDQALVELVISRNMGLVKSKVRALNFQRSKFQLFKDLVIKILEQCP